MNYQKITKEYVWDVCYDLLTCWILIFAVSAIYGGYTNSVYGDWLSTTYFYNNIVFTMGSVYSSLAYVGLRLLMIFIGIDKRNPKS